MSQNNIKKCIDHIPTYGLPTLYRYQENQGFGATLAILGAAGLGWADKLEDPNYDFSLVKTTAEWKRVLLCNLGLYRQIFMNLGYLEYEWKSAVRSGSLLEVQLYEGNNKANRASVVRQTPTNTPPNRIIVATESFRAIAERAQYVITLLHLNLSISLKLSSALFLTDSNSRTNLHLTITRGLTFLRDSFKQGIVIREAALIKLMSQVRKL